MTTFYDQLSDFYDLIYVDWAASVTQQGAQLSALINTHWPEASQVLDVTCGIGTQAIGLSEQGFNVTASDLSSAEIARAQAEAAKRDLSIALSVCDMRQAHEHHARTFDVVISCDNSIAHLLDDAALLAAFASMHQCTAPGGGCIVSMRDYANEPRGKNIFKPYGVRVRDRQRYVIYQLWDFTGERYDLTFVFVQEDLDSREVTTHVMRSQCYAVTVTRVAELMAQAGFDAVSSHSDVYFQPCIVGTRAR